MHRPTEELQTQLHLAVLGLKQGVSYTEVRGRYRELVVKWHPDQFHTDPAAAAIASEQLRQINSAFHWLRDNRPIWEQLQHPVQFTSTPPEERSQQRAPSKEQGQARPPNATPSAEAPPPEKKTTVREALVLFTVLVTILVVGVLSMPLLVSK